MKPMTVMAGQCSWLCNASHDSHNRDPWVWRMWLFKRMLLIINGRVARQSVAALIGP